MSFANVLATIQAAAIIVLLALVWNLGNEVDRLKIQGAGNSAPPIESTNPEAKAGHPLVAQITEPQLRTIIREELASTSKAVVYAPETVNPSTSGVQNNLVDEQKVEEVEDAISYFVSVGSISEMQMGNLQGRIARLDEENRKLMLKKLMVALNTGLIDGRL